MLSCTETIKAKDDAGKAQQPITRAAPPPPLLLQGSHRAHTPMHSTKQVHPWCGHVSGPSALPACNDTILILMVV